LLGTASNDPGPLAGSGRAVTRESYDETSSPQGGSSSSPGSGIGFRGFGLRVGVADDPDQVVGGVHFNLGEFVRNLRFQPDVQLGAGDDHTTIYGTAPVYYRFEADTSFTPYAGGGVSVGWVDRDDAGPGNGDDSDFETGGKATAGLEWPMSSGGAFFVELSLGLGDVHDLALLAAWSF
jgi:opacity protein-like surface antigen